MDKSKNSAFYQYSQIVFKQTLLKQYKDDKWMLPWELFRIPFIGGLRKKKLRRFDAIITWLEKEVA